MREDPGQQGMRTGCWYLAEPQEQGQELCPGRSQQGAQETCPEGPGGGIGVTESPREL